jgi:large subunit ribosomal protein L24
MATATPKASSTDRIKMRIRKGDTVQVIAGTDKGQTGAVLRTLPNENRLIVEGVNMRTRHEKPNQEGESGRIVTEEAALHASNVMLYSTSKKVASRVEIVVEKDGSKKRRLKKTGELID